MKLRLKALLLALGLAVSSLSMSVYAEEETGDTEPVSESALVTAISSEADSEADQEDSGESEGIVAYEVVTEDNGQTELENVAEEGETEEASMEDTYKELLTGYLTQISDWSEDQVEELMDSEDEVTALIALNWDTVMAELGDFEEVTEITDVQSTASGYGGIVTGIAKYSGVGKSGTVTVTLEYEYEYSTIYSQYMMELKDIEWQIDYTMGSLLQKAALNTVMGICIVFLFLAVLSFLISRIRYIPALLDSRKKKEEPGSAEEAAVEAPEASSAAPAAVETAPADDLELVAVISAAVAAYREEEGASPSGDSYVVRSIRKINNKNNKNWRKA